eukprot:824410-Rhodomonas_salina.1
MARTISIETGMQVSNCKTQARDQSRKRTALGQTVPKNCLLAFNLAVRNPRRENPALVQIARRERERVRVLIVRVFDCAHASFGLCAYGRACASGTRSGACMTFVLRCAAHGVFLMVHTVCFSRCTRCAERGARVPARHTTLPQQPSRRRPLRGQSPISDLGVRGRTCVSALRVRIGLAFRSRGPANTQTISDPEIQTLTLNSLSRTFPHP